MINKFENMQLANKWKWCITKEIGSLINGDRGKNYPSRKHYVNFGIPFISAGNLHDGKIAIDGLNFITEEKFNDLNNGKLVEGDIIYCLRGTLGKIAIFTGLKLGAISSSLVILRLSDAVNRKYIFCYLDSPFGKELIRHFDNGTAQPNLSAESVSKYQIPLAPFHEQNAIVDKIEQLFSDLDNAIDNLKKAKDQLKVYRQSVLKYAFEGKLTKEWRKKHSQVKSGKEILSKIINKVKQPVLDLNNCVDIPQEWLFTSIINLVAPEKSSLKRGPFGSAIKKAFFVPSGYKVYEQQNAIKKDCSLGTYYINQDKFNELRSFAVCPGDFIVSCAGTIGCITVVPEGSEEGVINQALLKIKLNADLIVNKYFIHQFESYVQQYMRVTSKGSAMKNMSSVKDLKQIPFVYTSIEEQNQIIQEIESRFSVCDKMEETIENSLNQAEALRQSILKQAFEGKLTEEWRKEHPELISGENSAKALLEKIKAEREVLKNTRKRKK